MDRYNIHPDYNKDTHWWLSDEMENIFTTTTKDDNGEWVKWDDVMEVLLRMSKLSGILIMDNEGRILI